MTPLVLQARELGYRVRRSLAPSFNDNLRSSPFDDFCGACGIASAMIAHDLERPDALVLGKFLKRQHHQLLYTEDHCWLELDGYIVDATATQFGWYAAVHIERAVDAINYVAKHRGVSVIGKIRTWYDEYGAFFRKFARQAKEIDDEGRPAGRVSGLGRG